MARTARTQPEPPPPADSDAARNVVLESAEYDEFRRQLDNSDEATAKLSGFLTRGYATHR